MSTTLESLDQQMACLMQCDGWEVLPVRSHIVFKAPGKKAAYRFIRQYSDALSRYRCPVYVTFDDLTVITANNCTGEKIMEYGTYLELGQQAKLTLALLRIADDILSHPEKSRGLVRLEDQAQIVVSGGGDGRYLMGAAPNHYSQLKRPDYWSPESLADFERDWRRRLTVGGDWETFEYMIRYPSPGKDLSPGLPPDTRMITDFRLVDDGFGNLFHYCQNRDLTSLI